MNPKEKDPFSYDTQGEKYDIFRPPYPDVMFDFVLKQLQKDALNLLDIGTGTGKVLFALEKHFPGLQLGVDRSDTQLKVAREKADKLGLDSSKVQFLNYDVFKLEEIVKEKGNKFDLVTMGQCLHWFDYEKILGFISQSLLTDSGVFAVLNYFCEGFLYNTIEDQDNQQLLDQEALSHYKKFYQKVKPFFDCDRDGLENAFQDHSSLFGRNFKNVEKKELTVLSETSLDSFISYMRTYSGYNRFLDATAIDQMNPNPLEILESETKERLKLLGEKGILSKENPIRLKMRFYTIVCSK